MGCEKAISRGSNNKPLKVGITASTSLLFVSSKSTQVCVQRFPFQPVTGNFRNL